MKKLYTALSLIFATPFTQAQTVTTYDYTGGLQTFTVPAGITSLDVEVIGAQGGNAVGDAVGWTNGPVNIDGALGGRVTCTIVVSPGEVLNIYVGGQGAMPAGGYNGGGSAAVCAGTEVISAGGGGGSDIRQGGVALANRTVVSGGGGGAAGSASMSYAVIPGTGAGGGLSGQNSAVPSSGPCTPGLGGTAAAGGNGGNNSCWCGLADIAGAGSLGAGGTSVCAPSGLCCCSCTGTGCTTGGGGGGGYYGGGAGICFAGGGGGSSYTTPSATSVIHTQGFQTGNGQVIVTYFCTALTPSVSDTEVCEGETVTLSAVSGSGGTITWDGGVTDGVAFVPPVGTTTYTATSSDLTDCAYAVDITVNALPTVNAGTDQDICEGDMATLIPSGTATTYSWDGGVITGLPFSPPAGVTTYTVTGTDLATGCENTDQVDVNGVVIDETVVAGGGTITSNEVGAAYQWIDCGTMTDIAGETNQSFTIPGNGSYAVEVTVSGCVDTSACLDVFSGIGEQDLSIFSLVPNPSEGQVSIRCNGQFQYQISDISGKILVKSSGSNATLLDLSGWSKGIYFVSVRRDGMAGTQKLVIR